jgi:hypothetical protein
MAKRKKTTAKAVEPAGAETTPPQPSRAPSPQRPGSGREDAPSSGPSEPALTPSRSEVAGDFLQFVANLRANAGEAMRFVEDKVALRLAAPATARAETRFRTRAERLAQGFRDRKAEFQSLDARCLQDDPCRPFITALGSSGLPRILDIVDEEISDIATRAAAPISDEDREGLLLDAAALFRNLTALLDLADVIMREAKAIRDASGASVEHQSALSQELAGKILESEQEAQRFYEVFSSRPPSIERSADQTVLGWLSHVLEEYERFRDGGDKFAAVLRKFTDEDRDAAEKAGHDSLVSFLREKERVLVRFAARRNVSISVMHILINHVIHRLSLNERGLNAADEVIRQLNAIAGGLDEQRQRFEQLATIATADRLAEEAATESDLPEWNTIVRSRPGDGSRLSGLNLLVAAFCVETGSSGPTFGHATKNELAERLDELFPHEGPFAAPWIDRHVKEAVRRKIAIQLPAGTNRRLPHVFRLSAAAIRKYGPDLPDTRRRQG